MKVTISCLLLLVLLLPHHLVQSKGDLISKTCKKTPHYDLCLSTLESNPESIDTDVKGLACIVANTTLLNATDTLAYIQELINETIDPQMERPLAYCGEVYMSIVHYILPQAIDALIKEEYEFARYGIDYASDEADSCENKFSGTFKSPLTDRNQLLHNLCNVVDAIIKIVYNGN